MDGPGSFVIEEGPDGLARQHTEPERVCEPIPRFGPGALGEPCETDESCGRQSPTCIEGFCTRPCTWGPCEPPFACAMARLIADDHLITAEYCVPASVAP